jgi:hypothetical protein
MLLLLLLLLQASAYRVATGLVSSYEKFHVSIPLPVSHCSWEKLRWR